MKLSNQADLISGQSMFKILAKAQQLEIQGKQIFHLEIGDPYFDTHKSVVKATCEALNKGQTHYANSLGLAELRQEICYYTVDNWGFSPLIEQVCVAPAHLIIYFALRCLVNPDDEVVYPDPSFPSYLADIKLVGAKPIPVQLKEENGFRLKFVDIEKVVTDKTRLIILNSPSNPTGAIMDASDLIKIDALAELKDIWILSDEVYYKMAYDKSVVSISTIDECLKRTILLNSFSKIFSMSGFRLGYAIAPPEVIEKFGLMVQSTISCVPPFIQYAGIAALKDCVDYNKKIVKQLKAQRDWVVKEFNDMGLSCATPDGAFYLMPNITKTGMNSQLFADFMLDKGVALLPGTDFGQYGEGYVRISYASKPESLKGAINKMKDVLK